MITRPARDHVLGPPCGDFWATKDSQRRCTEQIGQSKYRLFGLMLGAPRTSSQIFSFPSRQAQCQEVLGPWRAHDLVAVGEVCWENQLVKSCSAWCSVLHERQTLASPSRPLISPPPGATAGFAPDCPSFLRLACSCPWEFRTAFRNRTFDHQKCPNSRNGSNVVGRSPQSLRYVLP